MFRRYFFSTSSAKNAKVFFDINIEGNPVGRIVFEVSLYFIISLRNISLKKSYSHQQCQKQQKISENFALEIQFLHFLKNNFISKVKIIMQNCQLLKIHYRLILP